MMRTYLVVIGKTATGYSTHCPGVLGCALVGETAEEVLSNMKEALEFHFDGMAEDGAPIPEPGGAASYRAEMKDLDVDRFSWAMFRSTRAELRRLWGTRKFRTNDISNFTAFSTLRKRSVPQARC